MNRLSNEKRAKILHLLVEGTSMRAITRLEGVGINTVTRLMMAAGAAAWAYHDSHVCGIPGHRRLECDELWSFIYSKQKNVDFAKAAPPSAGDAWTFTAIDADYKVIISYLVGQRDQQTAIDFMEDLWYRLDDRPQISTDGLRAYVPAVDCNFGEEVDFAQIIKDFQRRWWKDGKYSPEEVVTVTKRVVTGNPDMDTVSTSMVERHNLSIRMGNRRYTRLTNAFSKRLDKHQAMLNLWLLHYNWCRKHRSLGTTPAYAMGLADDVKDFDWIVELIDARAPKPNRPKTYNKRRVA